MVSSNEASLGDQEDASKQRRKIDDIDADAEITLVDETQGRHDDDLMFDTGVLNDEEVFAGQDMIEKEVSTTDPITTAGEVVTTANVAVSTVKLKSVKPKVTTATTTTTKGILLQEPSETRTTTTTIPSKDKGKEWNDIQAKIETYYELAQRLQVEEQEELTIEEKSKLFIQLLEARKKHFAVKRAEEKRNRPPIKAQQRSIMVNTFVDMDTKLLEGSEVRVEGSETREESSSKREGDEIEQEKAKKQKVDEDKETAELQSLMKVIPDEEEVAVDAIPLATKRPSIVDYKILKEGKISYYQIIRADGSSKRPEEGYKRVLWGDLKTMFEHHVEDLVWRNLQGNKVLVWKLFDSCGVHFVRRHFKSLILDELRSHDFNLFSDPEYSEEEKEEAMAETMEQYMSKTRTDYGSGVARPKIEEKDSFELKGQFLKELRENTFSGSDNEDANEHIEKVLKIVDLFHVPNITVDQLMLRVFPISLTGAASHWLRNEPTGSIKTWEDLKTKFLNKYCPPGRTAKKMEEINNFQQEPDETLYQAWERFKELLMKCPQHYLTEMQETTADAKKAIQEMAEYSQKWHNGTSRGRSTETSDGLAAIQEQLNNLGREIKTVNEKVYAAQVRCEQCKGPHYTKDCPLK
ncbi:retrovirus-related pol polyprotein from transposon TNT 1-94 [Tanacetum coccineum]|uniref:Retrovirus-related pol polyprotein from transposon TNT 1-94 n=1 Tax=Tanacetum coccineum TaxID=301880 RepID=A0ABQ5CZY0_9ASTR